MTAVPKTPTADSAQQVLRPVWWNQGAGPRGALQLIDQTLLPGDVVYVTCTTVQQVWEAIKSLQVRGAPAIGVAAAYGVLVGLNEFWLTDDWRGRVRQICQFLSTSRPTAVNLFWALDRMRRRADSLGEAGWPQAFNVLLAEAHAIRNEDAAMCRAIGTAGRNLIPDDGGVITHCNAGALATSEYGTALAAMYAAHEAGRKFRVFVDETRPLLQGARLTAWELTRAGIETVLMCDNMAAVVMVQKQAQVVIVGADRIAANGDTANKIGTYGLAVLAAAHRVPFYVAAPATTFDLSIHDGSAIPIEYRDAEEVRRVGLERVAPEDVPCFSPAFDVTPATLITGIITNRGLIHPVSPDRIRQVLGR
jgi:methylthioribose-1-phosphate isomerase